jgi:dTDP-4-dehydrorhamnose 3,5-epimerase
MIFSKTAIEGAFLIRPERLPDERGFFARTYCIREMEAHGLDPRVVQRSVSYNRCRGTLRGMHFQLPPHDENKIVSCSRGAIHDVIIDLRSGSQSYRRWLAVALTAEGFETLYVPRGCAHGFITLEDETVVNYDISDFHHPESARGVRFDDPAFAIEWPMAPVVINARDQAYPPFSESEPRGGRE